MEALALRERIKKMLITYPDYYKDFSCIAGECEDTCCAGWEIMIDSKSLQRYKKEQSDFSKRLQRDIRWRKGAFRQLPDGRCAFLREDGLCDMYRNLGSDSLCKTCRSYPRHTEEFENVREITLSVSCPEVARILLSRVKKVQFISKETELDENYEDFDYFLFSALQDARTAMIDILQDRSLDIGTRLTLVLGIAHDMQRHAMQGRLCDLDEILVRACSERGMKLAKNAFEKWQSDEDERYRQAKRNFYRLCKLERLRDNWEQLLLETQMLLYVRGAKSYAALHREFVAWAEEYAPILQIQLEQLAVYFISTYFLGAVYDERIYGKVDTAAAYVAQIYDLLLARWLKNEKQLDLTDTIDVVYRYSREIEHSDENLERMETWQWWRMK